MGTLTMKLRVKQEVLTMKYKIIGLLKSPMMVKYNCQCYDTVIMDHCVKQEVLTMKTKLSVC